MQVKFVPQDFWVGLYWKSKTIGGFGGARRWKTTVYLCLIPCLPITWTFCWLQHRPNRWLEKIV